MSLSPISGYDSKLAFAKFRHRKNHPIYLLTTNKYDSHTVEAKKIRCGIKDEISDIFIPLDTLLILTSSL